MRVGVACKWKQGRKEEEKKTVHTMGKGKDYLTTCANEAHINKKKSKKTWDGQCWIRPATGPMPPLPSLGKTGKRRKTNKQRRNEKTVLRSRASCLLALARGVGG